MNSDFEIYDLDNENKEKEQEVKSNKVSILETY